MNSNNLTIAGPFTHENLSIFLLRGADAFDGSRFIPLDDAMEQKCVIVHETGEVGQLEVENLSDELDLYIQAGDVVKGGRQDRTLGVDFVLPAKSGRVPIPSFCVESGRWHRRAAWIPQRAVDAVSADGHKVFEPVRKHPSLKPFSATWLAEASDQQLLKALELIPAAYDKWIAETEGQFFGLNKTLQSFAAAHRALWINARDRMIAAIGWLKGSNAAIESFKLANRAMAMQRQWSRKEELKWRPFQVAFQLLVLQSTLDGKHDDRSVMDLLWFPTGGGKTEAYLAVIALVMFYRRLSRKNPDEGAGVNVIMRYTLRVLTTQQFERAAFLICACEKIRIERKLEAGDNPFSIGLWVGSTAIPNKVAEAHADAQLRAMQIKNCPCCGNKLSVHSDKSKFAILCLDPSCFFGKRGEPLPIWTVDEDVYRELPSLLIGTIDKFAQIARNRLTGGLFGLRTSHSPPDLIIQDELHLISGPLGTIAGLYEVAVDEFCSSQGAIPKIIGSTATIKMADEQVLALFRRQVFQFPPPGIDAADSCFAIRDASSPSRPSAARRRSWRLSRRTRRPWRPATPVRTSTGCSTCCGTTASLSSATST